MTTAVAALIASYAVMGVVWLCVTFLMLVGRETPSDEFGLAGWFWTAYPGSIPLSVILAGWGLIKKRTGPIFVAVPLPVISVVAFTLVLFRF